MSFTRMTQEVNNISQLADRPNDNGMNAAQLKAAFDAAGVDIKAFINAFLDELEADGAAGNIGFSSELISNAATVKEAIEAIYGTTIDSLPDDAVTTAKIRDRNVTGDKIADTAVATTKLADLAVTTAKIASEAVSTAKLGDNAVTGAKLADGAVATAKLGAGSVTQTKMANDSVGTNQIINGSVTPAKTTGLQKQHTALTVTVPAITTAGGTQTVNATGVTAENTVLVSPDSSSWVRFRDCGVRCSGQGAGTLTFTAESASNEALDVNVLILD